MSKARLLCGGDHASSDTTDDSRNDDRQRIDLLGGSRLSAVSDDKRKRGMPAAMCDKQVFSNLRPL
uniref:Uncharacterized protein n=1 Tax=uncultured bacterium 5H7 TaxID=1701327 RepID=A0A0N7F2C4_9BACT|nr:hypothetical protein 5H7_059 [uncultured bacterium 5H7]